VVAAVGAVNHTSWYGGVCGSCVYVLVQAFHRRNLMESTSMVNSPVDIVALEKERLANASTALRSEFAR